MKGKSFCIMVVVLKSTDKHHTINQWSQKQFSYRLLVQFC